MSTVIVLGASGHVGSAVMKTLASKSPSTTVLAGVRDVNADKSKALVSGANVKLVPANLSEPATLAAAIPNGVDAVFVNTPGDINRKQQAINGITAAKNANAKLVVIVSVLSVERTGCIFADQFQPIEAFAKSAGVPYVLLRLPLFIDNNWGNLHSIKEQGKIYGPNSPDAKFTPIAIQDIADVAAAVLSNPGAHQNKTYGKLTTKAYSNADLARAFSAATGKQVDYVQVPYEGAKQAMLGMGFQEWQVDGIIELLKDIENKESYYTSTGDVKAITGHEPLTIEQWTQQVGGAFK